MFVQTESEYFKTSYFTIEISEYIMYTATQSWDKFNINATSLYNNHNEQLLINTHHTTREYE